MRKEKRYPFTLSYDLARYVPRDLNANKMFVACQQDIVTELPTANSITSATQAESTSTSPAVPSVEKTSPVKPTPSVVLDNTTTDPEEDMVVSSERLGYATLFVVFVVIMGLCTWCGGFRRIKGMLQRADRAHYKRVGDEDLEK